MGYEEVREDVQKRGRRKLAPLGRIVSLSRKAKCTNQQRCITDPAVAVRVICSTLAPEELNTESVDGRR